MTTRGYDEEYENVEDEDRQGRLNHILDKMNDREEEERSGNGPRSTNKEFSQKMLKFFTSYIGLALLAFVLLFIVLIAVRPPFVFKNGGDEKRKFKDIQFGIVFGMALAGAVLVGVISYFIVKGQNNADSAAAENEAASD